MGWTDVGMFITSNKRVGSILLLNLSGGCMDIYITEHLHIINFIIKI